MVAERTRLAREQQKKAAEAYLGKIERKPPQLPLSQPLSQLRQQKAKAQRAAASAPTNGLLLAA